MTWKSWWAIGGVGIRDVAFLCPEIPFETGKINDDSIFSSNDTLRNPLDSGEKVEGLNKFFRISKRCSFRVERSRELVAVESDCQIIGNLEWRFSDQADELSRNQEMKQEPQDLSVYLSRVWQR
jgi:hypothetical protein